MQCMPQFLPRMRERKSIGGRGAVGPPAGGMPLAMVRDGRSGKIVRIAGRCELRRYLSNLGFVVGTDVSVVNTIAGSLLLEIRGKRIAMDRSMASKVFIIPEGS